MATTRLFSRLFLTTKRTVSPLLSHSYSSLPHSSPLSSSLSSLSTLSHLRLRPLAAASINFRQMFAAATSVRGFATRQTSSSLNDPNPNWSNRPPKETILLDGCDFEHWLVVVEKPEGEPTRDEIIDSYIKTLAKVVGSEEEARMKIYSVSTRHYFAFGALVSEELSYKIKELPGVRWVLPDSYLDVKNKDYGGEPFINGEAVPYDPKYHEEWVRNNARANERNRRNDRPRNFDRSRNFERRRENMQNPGPNMGGPPPNMGGPPNMGPNMGGPPNMGRMPPPPGNMGGPSNMGPPPPGNMGGPSNMGPPPPGNMGGHSNMGPPPPGNMGGPSNYPPMGGPRNAGGMQANMGGSWGSMHPNNMGGAPPNMGGMPNNAPPHFQDRNNGGMPYQNSQMSGPGPNREYQNNYAPNSAGGNPYQTENMQGRDPSTPNYQ